MQLSSNSGWDQYVSGQKHANVSHTSSYGLILKEVFGFKDRYFIARELDHIKAVIPFFQIGRRFLCLPFWQNAFPLIDPDQSPVLLQEIVAGRVMEGGGREIQFNGLIDYKGPECNRMRKVAGPRYIRLDLRAGEKTLWDRQIDYSVRKAVSKARRNGLTCENSGNTHALLDIFYPLYVRSMIRLGSPPLPKKYYEMVGKLLPDKFNVAYVRKEGKCISALFGFVMNGAAQITAIASEPHFWDLRPNDLAHWSFIEWACRNGFSTFDFGVARYEGQTKYKSKWGADDLEYCTWFLTDRKCVHKAVDYNAWYLRLSGMLWKKMATPLVAQSLGRYFLRHMV